MRKFQELEYVRPDYAAAEKSLTELAGKLEKAADYEEMKRIFFEKQKQERELSDQLTICHIRHDIDTTDQFYADEMIYHHKMRPTLIGASKAWNQALLASAFRKEFEEEFGSLLFKKIELEEKVQSPEIAGELVEQSMLVDEYSKITAGCSVDFHGETCNFYGLLKHMESTDRAVRKEAYLAWAKMYEDVADKLDDVYYRMVQLRAGMAKKMGFDSYIPFAYAQRGRIDYTPEDAAGFRRQVLENITPFADKLRRAQAARLGLDKLRYYDEMLAFPEGNADPKGDRDFMVAAASKMYSELSPETREFFGFMVEHELFDLVSRPGKHMGGYCTMLIGEKAPFIFSNFNGTSADTDVLTHEAGHAFESFTASRRLPIDDLIWSTSEINEIHSMSMETFTYPWMKYIHLVTSLAVMPYMCVVDEFQEKVFTDPSISGKEYRGLWRSIEKKYMPWRDYDGVEFLEEGGFWMQKQHIFMYPFYYLDYALAQTCAFQFFTRMQENREEAWNGYLKLCQSGGSRGYFDTLEYAGLDNPFKEGTVAKSILGVKQFLNEIEKKL